MKKITFYIITLFLFFYHLNSSAQSILVVEPGVGTLNTAITTYGATRIYQLKAGEWYAINAPIENVNYHLQIIGAEPAVAGGLPATLQTMSDVNGAVFSKMFDSRGDITLKNIYIINADLNAQVATDLIVESKDKARVTVDKCVIHPVAVSACVRSFGGNVKIFLTNNQIIDHGHQLSPNDGHFINQVHATIGLDSLYVENNTFVCMGVNFFYGGYGTLTHNVININHNSFILTKSQLDWSTKKMEEYWTNNLFYDVNTQPYSKSWEPMPGADLNKPKPNLIFAGPLDNETLPSLRPNFVEYNSHYRAKGFYDLLDEMNAFAKTKSLPPVYFFPLVWPKDSTNCREAQMFNSIDYPNFKYGNTMTDVDPQWVDTKIYDHEANFVKWSKPANYIHALNQPSTNYPPASTWTQYWWIPSNDLSNNSVWPVFNGKYNNVQSLTGSIENLPLGDLNWFPSAKALWSSNKARIDAHIKAGNTWKLDLTAIDQVKTDLLELFPNPAKNEFIIKNAINPEVSIFSLDGKKLLVSKNSNRINISQISNGSYLISIKEGDSSTVHKLIIEK